MKVLKSVFVRIYFIHYITIILKKRVDANLSEWHHCSSTIFIHEMQYLTVKMHVEGKIEKYK